ncbi:MAG: hypothetical protein ABIJ82_03005 [Patescibacteria group bacterium]|nr:hypothetical protein [Patescibacteria group bacterium]MBU1953158.1 hypothetical protein [Patescibacteria group bacterium]
MKVPKVLKFSGLFIILFLVIFYASTLVAYRYGAKCHCYGFKTNGLCLGINTVCTGLGPALHVNFNNNMTENCNSQKDANTLTIDFAQCKNCEEIIYVGFGSTTYEMYKSQDDNYCTMQYGGEIENPNWKGDLNTTCTVPRNIGIKTFNITNYGVDFSSLAAYCK